MTGERRARASRFAVQADGAEIRTVEGLADGADLHPLQDAFWEKQGLQCGYCTPGMLMRCLEILEREPDPTPEKRPRADRAATSAAAPATRTSSKRCARPPRP